MLPILSFFIISRVDRASAVDTVDLGSTIGLVKPKLEKSLYSHPASRLDISNKMGSVKLSPCVEDKWANDNFFSKNERFFAVCRQLGKQKCNYLELTKKTFKMCRTKCSEC